MGDLLVMMKGFVAVADLGSFSRAADQLGLSQSTISKQINNLERHLGAALILRTTRSISLTVEGTAFYEGAQRALAAVDEAESSVGLHTIPGGPVRMTAPLTLAKSRIIPMISRFLRLHPDIAIDFHISDHALNLVSDNLDLAVRVGALGDSRNIVRKIGVARRVMVASPDYLAKRGRPRSPNDLKAHNCISYSLLSTGVRWNFDNHAPVDIEGNFRADSPDALRAAALAGIGIATNALWLFEDDLASGMLELVLPEFIPISMPIHVVMPPGRYQALRTRMLVDFLVKEFSDDRLLSPK